MNQYIIIIGIIVAFLAVIAIYFYMKDSARNNFRRAKKHHKLAEKKYKKKEFGEADEHYELSNFYREKAEMQARGEK
ncbi:hypothetical protein GF327_02015 [Candidatus Woesearchaeota archaeon]|nr:hypothetical protein [Candidatus Woesearchaeota archaeon]